MVGISEYPGIQSVFSPDLNLVKRLLDEEAGCSQHERRENQQDLLEANESAAQSERHVEGFQHLVEFKP